jgi:hypothetical protein
MASFYSRQTGKTLEPTVFVYHARTLLVDNTAGLTINGYFSCLKKRIVYYRTASDRSQISDLLVTITLTSHHYKAYSIWTNSKN